MRINLQWTEMSTLWLWRACVCCGLCWWLLLRWWFCQRSIWKLCSFGKLSRGNLPSKPTLFRLWGCLRSFMRKIFNLVILRATWNFIKSYKSVRKPQFYYSAPIFAHLDVFAMKDLWKTLKETAWHSNNVPHVGNFIDKFIYKIYRWNLFEQRLAERMKIIFKLDHRVNQLVATQKCCFAELQVVQAASANQATSEMKTIDAFCQKNVQWVRKTMKLTKIFFNSNSFKKLNVMEKMKSTPIVDQLVGI